MAHFGHHLLTAITVPMLPLIRSEFSLDYTQSGLVVSAFTVTYGISQLLSGWLADHIGRRVSITVATLGVAVLGLAVGLAHTYVLMIAFLALMGMLGGGYHPSASPAISSIVEPGNRSTALGIHLIGGSASYFLAPLMAIAIASALGWRGSYIVLAIPAIIFGSIFYLAMRRLPVLDKVKRKAGSGDNQSSEPPGRIRRLVAVIILSSFSAGVMFSSISFLPLFLVDHFNASKEVGGIFISIYYSTGLWSSTLGGYLADRFGKIKIMLLACFSLGFLSYFLNLAPFGVALGALVMILGMFNYFRMPVVESYVIQNTSEKRRSTVMGIYFFTATEGSGVLSPLIGYLIDNLGFYYTYTITAVSIVIVTTICSLLLRGSRD